MQDVINFNWKGDDFRRTSGIFLYNLSNPETKFKNSFVFNSTKKTNDMDIAFRISLNTHTVWHATDLKFYQGTLIRKATKIEVIKIMKLINQD